MYSNEPIVYRKERRQKQDPICLWLQLASVLVWIVLFVILLIYQESQPPMETFWDRLLAVQIRDTLDYSKINIIFYLLITLFILSAVSLVLNFKRLKRSTDRIRVSFIISLVGSVIGMFIYLFAYTM